ncbi:MAG TPA: hypothetical protein VMH01_14970 [Puia sp.]|nr:hypothetical protein [Puia sp.]
MKRINLIIAGIAILVLLHCSSYAQYYTKNQVSPVRVGSTILNLGIGAGADYKNDYYNTPFGAKMAIEWGLWQAGPGVITLGGETGGSFSNDRYYGDRRPETIVFAGRSAWHYGWKVRGLDTYGGLSAGIGIHHYEYNGDVYQSGTETIPVLGAFVGASYFVSPHFGFNSEMGFDITNFQVGVVFKLN